MGWHGRQVKEDGNHHKCWGRWDDGDRECGTLVYWREGDYCAAHQNVPERRCLDCGKTSRTGILAYNREYRQPVPVPEWQVFEGPRMHESRPPKAIKPRTDQRMYVVVAPGTCRYCESANLAPLEFGMDRLPAEQATCAAWPTLDNFDPWHGSYTSWLSKAAGDPGIRLKMCATCDKPLAALKAHGNPFGARLGEWRIGIRNPRVDLPDGHWRTDPNRWVHTDCPDPEPVPVAA